ncbi:MAG: hypothetical protein DMG06_05125 [Acidobacteria bacterium]|nr:MAG: hypothetical protein DMG06_05125 [Acidobacteriota bacterium]
MVYPYDLHSTSRGKLPSLTQLISSSQGDCSPEFSPDGKKVAFVSERSGMIAMAGIPCNSPLLEDRMVPDLPVGLPTAG